MSATKIHNISNFGALINDVSFPILIAPLG
jgi:hypothetical protein